MRVGWLTQGRALSHSENVRALDCYFFLLPTPNPCPYLGSWWAKCHFFEILDVSKPLTTDPEGVSCIQLQNLCLAVGWEEMGLSEGQWVAIMGMTS